MKNASKMAITPEIMESSRIVFSSFSGLMSGVIGLMMSLEKVTEREFRKLSAVDMMTAKRPTMAKLLATGGKVVAKRKGMTFSGARSGLSM